MSAYFEVRDLSHQYNESTIFRSVGFGLEKGETLALLGESGQGKSTLLLCLAGLVRPCGGYIGLGGEALFSEGLDCPPERRGMGLVFQEHCLFPHLRVRDNISFGAKRGDGGRVKDLMDTFGLSAHGAKFPCELSGGQQQCAAIARALASSPEVLLFDEPFAHLDRRLRFRLRRELRWILEGESMTAIFVTHDREEAYDMGDRVAILNGGAIEQTDTPFNLYHFPQSTFVARFVGSGLFLPGRVLSDFAQWADTDLGKIPIRNGGSTGEVELYLPAGGIEMSRKPGPSPLRGEVLRKFFRGEGNRYDVRLAGTNRVFENLNCRKNFDTGENVFISWVGDTEATAFYSER